MINDYIDLLAAVYKQAVRDDVITATSESIKRLEKIIKLPGTPDYSNKSPKFLIWYKIKAKEYVSRKKQYIEGQIRQSVAKESQEWGAPITRRIQAEGIARAVDGVITQYLEECHESRLHKEI